MDPKYIEALQILIIGMGTVFTILFLVVQLSKLLVSAVNRFGQRELSPPPSTSSVPRAHMVAIMASVDQVTAGRGMVQRITKIEKA